MLMRATDILYFKRDFFVETNFLPDININSFFVKPIDKTDIQSITLSLNPLKAVGPNSIPTKILKLLTNNISSHLPELFNFSLLLGGFPQS